MYLIGLTDGLTVQFGAETVTKFRTRKSASLLAYLALHPGNHSREKLLEIFWPDLELDAARHALSMTLGYLRGPLEKEGAHTQTHLIQATRDCVGLVRGSYTTDLDTLLKTYDESVNKKETRVLLEIQRGRGTQSAVLKVTF